MLGSGSYYVNEEGEISSVIEYAEVSDPKGVFISEFSRRSTFY